MGTPAATLARSLTSVSVAALAVVYAAVFVPAEAAIGLGLVALGAPVYYGRHASR